MKLAMTIATLAMLAGCAATGTSKRSQAAGMIRYETGPCFGACPIYAVTVSSDGSGTFEGKHFTSVAGSRSFRVTASQFRQFARVLAPYRPNGTHDIVVGKADCGESVTDSSTVRIDWDGRDHLTYYTGCRTSDAAMSLSIRSAPELLPIASMIGKH